MGATPTRTRAAARPEFLNPQLAAAMSHPTRVHAMSILCEREASPRQLAELLGERLNNVTYHVNQLLKLGCIELVRTEHVRGGRVLEHVYHAKKRLYFDEEAWNALSEKERLDLVSVSLRMISEDVTTAMRAGTIFGDDSSHLTRTAMVVDAEGWREITDAVERATAEVLEIEDAVAERAAAGAEPDLHARVEILQFRAPPFAEPADDD